MASGTIYGSTNNTYIDAKIVWSSVANTAANTSTVTATLYYKRSNEYITSGTGSFSIKIGTAAAVVNTQYLQIGSNWVKAVAATQVVTHELNGSKSVAISASGAISGTTLESTTCGSTVTLDTIPRATTLDQVSVPATLESSFTYKYTPRGSYYTRVAIYLVVGSKTLSLRLIPHGIQPVGTQQTQTITLTAAERSQIYKVLPTTAQAVIQVTARTYSDAGYSVKVGDASTKEVTTSIPAGIKPSASLTASPVNNNAWIKEKNIYVAGYSGLTATLSGTSGEGAPILTYAISGGGYSANSNVLKVTTLLQAGKLTLKGVLTDSRSRTGTAEYSLTVESYTTPQIRSLTVTRGTYNSSTQAWTPDDNGPDVRVYFTTYLSLIQYANAYSVAFTINGVAQTPNYGSQSNLNSSVGYAFYFINMDSESSHTLKITAQDYAGGTGSATITVPTTYVTMEFKADGKGIAFGKTSEKNAFECDMTAEFTGAATFKGATTINEDLDLKKNIHMGGLNGQTHEQVIRFSNPTSSQYPHNAYLYGGNPNSVNTIGCYDGRNNRSIWGYNDTTNTVSLGGNSSIIVINGSTLADFVVEQGTSGIWSYRKWYSGICELHAYHKSTTAIDIQQGGIYRSDVITLNLPFNVIEITPIVDCCDISAWASTNTFRSSTGNSTVTYVLFRGASYTSNDWYTHIHIKGRWK